MQFSNIALFEALIALIFTWKFYFYDLLFHWIILNFELLQDRITNNRCKSNSSFQFLFIILKELVDNTIFTFLQSCIIYDLSPHMAVALLLRIVFLDLLEELLVLFLI